MGNMARAAILLAVFTIGGLAGARWQQHLATPRIEALEIKLAEMSKRQSALKRTALFKQQPLQQSVAALEASRAEPPSPMPTLHTRSPGQRATAVSGVADGASVSTGVAPATPAAQLAEPAPPQPTPEQVRALASRMFRDFIDPGSESSSADRRRERRRLLEELRELGPHASEALIDELKGAGSSRVRSSAASLLGDLQDPIALPFMEELILNEQDTLVRRGIARGLRRMQDPDTIPVFEALLDDHTEDRVVRYQAAYGLARLGEPDGIPALVQLFEEAARDGLGRGRLFRTLRRLDNNAALPAMRQILSTRNDIYYQLGALEFLSRHGTREDAVLLETVMQRESNEPAIIESAARALAGLPR